MSALDVHIFWRSDVEKAAAFTGFSEDQIVGRVRTPELCETRFAIWLSMRSRGLSLPAIGHHFKRDHATIISGLRRAETLRASPAFSMLLEALQG